MFDKVEWCYNSYLAANLKMLSNLCKGLTTTPVNYLRHISLNMSRYSHCYSDFMTFKIVIFYLEYQGYGI